MEPQSIRSFIKILTIVWLIAGLVLGGLAFGGLLPKTLFQYIFAGGFIIYAVVVTLLTLVLANKPKKP